MQFPSVFLIPEQVLVSLAISKCSFLMEVQFETTAKCPCFVIPSLFPEWPRTEMPFPFKFPNHATWRFACRDAGRCLKWWQFK